MGNAYIFTLQPTFTQGLILGQFSILFLLILILKYLFFDAISEQPYKTPSYQPRLMTDDDSEELHVNGQSFLDGAEGGNGEGVKPGIESAEWFNVILQQVVDSYRMKVCDDLPGAEGAEVARKRVEAFANQFRPPGFLDPIRVHSVDLGVSAPRLSRARPRTSSPSSSNHDIEFDMSYTDTLSISLSTSVLFNYPFASFARLPVSLTISLSLFSSAVSITPPDPKTLHPIMTFTLPSPETDFMLDLKTTSLMGSRAKLADVPKLHELIKHQIRRVILSKGTWKVVLPGLTSVKEVKEDVRREQESGASPIPISASD